MDRESEGRGFFRHEGHQEHEGVAEETLDANSRWVVIELC